MKAKYFAITALLFLICVSAFSDSTHETTPTRIEGKPGIPNLLGLSMIEKIITPVNKKTKKKVSKRKIL
jgi:hypothetical protein